MKRRKFIKNNVGAVLAGPLAFDILINKKHQPEEPSFKAGFASADISSCIKTAGAFRRPLETVCASLNFNGARTIILTLDLMEMPLRENLRIQTAVSQATGIDKEHIIIHTTHTHSVPWNGDAGYTETEGLPGVLSSCISEAVKAEKTALMKTGNYNAGKSLSVYRLGDAGEELGFQTYWYGYAYHGDDPRPDASPLINEMKSRWRNEAPDYSTGPVPVWFDHDVDPLVQSVQFEDKRGRVIGTMVRFSAHPHITNHCINRLFDPDYPAFVRDYVSNITHSPVMFLSGTCGNTVPKDNVKFSMPDEPKVKFPYMGPVWGLKPESDEKLLSEARRIGEEIGEKGLKSLKNRVAERPEQCSFKSFNVALPLDQNLPASKNEIKKVKNILLEELNASIDMQAPLREIRGLANRLNWADWAGACGLRSLSQKERDEGVFDLPVTAVKLNDTVLLFMNSEISVETTLDLRKQFPQLNLFTVGLTGGTTGYLPTAQMIDKGGYEGRSTVFRRDAEEQLRRDIVSVLRDM